MNSLKERTYDVATMYGGHYKSYAVSSVDDMDSYLREFGDDFCYQVYVRVKQIVSNRVKLLQKSNVNRSSSSSWKEGLMGNFDSVMATFQEISLHHERTKKVFVGREGVVENLVDHCFTGSGAIVLQGPSGCGKSSILAQVARLVNEREREGKQFTLVLRFLGISPCEYPVSIRTPLTPGIAFIKNCWYCVYQKLNQ